MLRPASFFLLLFTAAFPASADVMCGGYPPEHPRYWDCEVKGAVLSVDYKCRTDLPPGMSEDDAVKNYLVKLRVDGSSLIEGEGKCPSAKETISASYQISPLRVLYPSSEVPFKKGDAITGRITGSNCSEDWYLSEAKTE